MKNSTVAALILAAFITGFLSGLMFAAVKGQPPGLESRARVASGPPAPAPPKQTPDWQGRLAALDQQIQAAPGQEELYIEAGNLLLDHERYQESLGYYQKALELNPENADVLTDMGVSYRRLGQPGRAVEYFRKARQADPGHATSALNLGIVFFHDLQDPENALKAWQEYLALNPQGQRADMIRQVVDQLKRQGEGN